MEQAPIHSHTKLHAKVYHLKLKAGNTALLIFYNVESIWLWNVEYPNSSRYVVCLAFHSTERRKDQLCERARSNNAFKIADAASHLAMPKYIKHFQFFNAESETPYLFDIQNHVARYDENKFHPPHEGVV